MKEDRFRKFHLIARKYVDFPGAKLAGQMAIMVAQTQFHPASALTQPRQTADGVFDPLHGQSLMNDIPENDGACRRIIDNQILQPAQGVIGARDWNELASRTTHPGLAQVQVRHGQRA